MNRTVRRERERERERERDRIFNDTPAQKVHGTLGVKQRNLYIQNVRSKMINKNSQGYKTMQIQLLVISIKILNNTGILIIITKSKCGV